MCCTSMWHIKDLMTVQMIYMYFLLVDSPKGVIELMDKVNRIINVDKKAKNIEQCLKFVGKTRRTLDRFRCIYYLYMVDLTAYEMVGNMYTVLTVLVMQIS